MLCITLFVVLPGGIVVLAVLVGLGQGEQEIYPGGLPDGLAIQPLLHFRYFAVVEAVGLQVGEAEVSFSKLRLKCQAAFIGIHALLLFAQCFQHMTQAQPGPRVFRIQFQGAAIGGCGLLGEGSRCQHTCQAVMRTGIVRLQGDECMVDLDRFLRALQFLQYPAQFEHGGDVVGCPGQGLPEKVFSLVEIACSSGDKAQHTQGIHMTRIFL